MCINMLEERPDQYGNQVMNASGGAYLLIATITVEATSYSDSVLIADDTDLLVLLCFITKSQHYTI